MTWIEKDGHAYQDEETMLRYLYMKRRASLFANIGLGIAGPLAAIVFVLMGGIGQVIADVGTHNLPLSVVVAVGIFLAPAPLVMYYGSKATFLHDSEKMKCYVSHSKWKWDTVRKKRDDDGPTWDPALPIPTVKI